MNSLTAALDCCGALTSTRELLSEPATETPTTTARSTTTTTTSSMATPAPTPTTTRVETEASASTILYRAIEQRDWKASTARLRHNPLEASTWIMVSSGEKLLPIHLACTMEPPACVVEELLKAFAGAASSVRSNGNLPLHDALEWGAPTDVVALLLRAHADGRAAPSGHGKTPLEIVKESDIDLLPHKAELEALLAAPDAPTTPATTTSTSTLDAHDHDAELANFRRSGLVVVVVGASGDLAKKKTYPSLLNLFQDDLLPHDVVIWGFARSNLTHQGLRDKLRPFLAKGKGRTDEVMDAFLNKCFYQQGSSYGDLEAFGQLAAELETFESSIGRKTTHIHRLFYFAIPPNVFAETGVAIKQTAMGRRGWNRMIIEKPFGRDLASCNEILAVLAKHFDEESLYRIDHYLGKELVQNLIVLRFSNMWFEPLWNRNHVKCVLLTFKEPFGTEGRGGYFDQYGIIRDVIQNHLLQVLTLLAMEAPVQASGPDAGEKIRDAKVQVLKSIPPITMDECFLGQYEGYANDESIPNKDTNTPTFCAIRCFVKTPRWDGVPFVFKAGKALNERKAEMRIQFQDAPAAHFLFNDVPCPRNELVMRLQPSEAIYLKTNVKTPGFSTVPTQGELEINYDSRFRSEKFSNPDAYTRLLLDVMQGNSASFVRDDELRRSWEIFTPILHEIERTNVRPVTYQYGSRGPEQADEWIAQKSGYVRSKDYDYQGPGETVS